MCPTTNGHADRNCVLFIAAYTHECQVIHFLISNLSVQGMFYRHYLQNTTITKTATKHSDN